MKHSILTAIAVCLLAVPVMADSPDSTVGPFVGTAYYHAIYGPDDGLNNAAVWAGMPLNPRSKGARWYAGIEMADFQPATHNGAEVKRDQGGFGPALIFVDPINWLPKTSKGKAIFEVFMVMPYVSHAQVVPDSAGGGYKFGFIPAGGLLVNFSEDSHLALGFRWHTAYEGFLNTASVGGGLFLSNADRKVAALAEGAFDMVKGIASGAMGVFRR